MRLRSGVSLGLFVVLVSVLLLLPRPAAALLFTDNFEGGASALWGNERGQWIASGGVYYAQSPGNSPQTYTSLPWDLADFIVELDVSVDYYSHDGGLWLHARSDPSLPPRADTVDIQSGVELVTYIDGFRWGAIRDGKDYYTMPDIRGLYAPQGTIHLRVEVEGDDYRVYLNGASTPATTFTFDVGGGGRFGLYDNVPQAYDNVVLSAPGSSVPEPASCALLALAVGGIGAMVRKRRKA